jgi:hypothetical protein
MTNTGNLFTLAERQLQKEGENYTISDVIDYAVKIRKWLDKHVGEVYGVTKAIEGKEAYRKTIYRETGK